jgi:2-methylcitrate dehydratase PrpD
MLANAQSGPTAPSAAAFQVPDQIGRALGQRLAELSTADVPDDILALTRLFVLDTLGVLAAGTKAPGIAELASAIQQMEPSGGVATILVGGSSGSPMAAALVNAAAAHALDYDDTHDVARVHAFSVVLPAALAAAEMEGNVSGRNFLGALALGAELFCRFGLACPNNLAKGWHPTTGFGCFAAAAVAAKLFGLTGDKMTQALALAYVQMSGNTQSIADGALSKRLGPGFAARNGVLAAHLSRAGLTGPWRFLEGAAGLFALYEDGGGHPDLLLQDLGAQWRLRELSMKPYPCCRCTHTLIHIGLDLHREGIDASEIESGTLYLGETNHGIVGARFDRNHSNPVVHAQFNACYAFAQALEDGEIGIHTFTKERVVAQTSLASRLTCKTSSEIPADALAPAGLRLVFKDGTERVVTRPTMKGSPEDPMSEADVMEKFSANLSWGWNLDAAQAASLAEQVFALGEAGDVRSLIKALGVASRNAGAN